MCKEGKAGSPVAIVAEKGVFTLAAMLGAAYAGDFYVMIDPSQPDGRMREIFEVLRPELTIVLDEAQQEDITGKYICYVKCWMFLWHRTL